MQMHVATMKIVYKGKALYRKNNESLFQDMGTILCTSEKKEKYI